MSTARALPVLISIRETNNPLHILQIEWFSFIFSLIVDTKDCQYKIPDNRHGIARKDTFVAAILIFEVLPKKDERREDKSFEMKSSIEGE